MSDINILRKAALSFRKKGLSTFPMVLTWDEEKQKYGKAPMPGVMWADFRNKLPTEQDIERWYVSDPFADDKTKELGIGLVLTKGLTALDFESNFDFSVCKEKGWALPVTTIQTTPSGGLHYLYRADPNKPPVKNRTRVEDLPFDIRGSDEGFIGVSPTQGYKWKTNSPIAPLPEWVYGIASQKAPVDWEEAVKKIHPIGDRDDTLASIIGKLVRDNEPAFWATLVWPAALKWNAEHNVPPLPVEGIEGVRKIYNSICEAELASRASRKDTELKPTAIQRGPFEFDPILLSSLTEEDHLDIDWIWEGFLAKGHITLLSALWKSGKTTLITALLRAIQEQNPLAGQATKAVKILIISEESKNMWFRRKEDHDLTLDIWIVPRPVNRRLSYIEWVNFINEALAFAQREGIELVVLDTISTFWSVTSENDASDVGAALLPLTSVAEKGMGVLMVHHFRKSGGEEGTAARGSGALGSYADILVDFSRMDKEDPKSTKRVIKTYSRFDETPLEVVIEYINDEYVTLGSVKEVKRESQLEVIVDILKTNTEPVTVQEIVDNWDEDLHGKAKTKRTVRRYIYDLLEKGTVVKDGEKTVGKKLTQAYTLSKELVTSPIRETSGMSLDNSPKNNKCQKGVFSYLSLDNEAKKRTQEYPRKHAMSLDNGFNSDKGHLSLDNQNKANNKGQTTGLSIREMSPDNLDPQKEVSPELSKELEAEAVETFTGGNSGLSKESSGFINDLEKDDFNIQAKEDGEPEFDGEAYIKERKASIEKASKNGELP